MKIIDIYNEFHFGDNIFNIIFINWLLDNTKEDLLIRHYCNSVYIKDVYQFVHMRHKNKVQVLPLEQRPQGAINCWIDNDGWFGRFIHSNTLHNGDIYYDNFFVEHFNRLRQALIDKEFTIDDFYFEYERENISKEKLDIIDSLDYDILLINSRPLSGQLKSYNEKMFAPILEMSEYKTISTMKDGNFVCTLDYGLSAYEVGYLSQKIKYCIGVNTGIMAPCFSKEKKNSGYIMLFDCRCALSSFASSTYRDFNFDIVKGILNDK